MSDHGAATRRATRALVARLYDIGARTAFLLMLLAVILMLVTGVDPKAGPASPPALVDWLPSLTALHPEAFIWAGIAVTAILPAITVAAAAVGFWRSGNRRPSLTAAAVLLALLATVIVAELTR
ncbi:MAG TPA: DUF1634 domain-containing protein [Candidatus Saccharimonadia bacterium]|nr:DUF1634 domain-containing protein [Candidatus Saccharimonadia bacterium]